MSKIIYELMTTKGDLLVVKSNLTISKLVDKMLEIHGEEIISHDILDKDEITDEDVDYVILTN